MSAEARDGMQEKSEILSILTSLTPDWPTHVYIAQEASSPTLDAFQVPFPRVDLVLSGCYSNRMCGADGQETLVDILPGECLFVPPNNWNIPLWNDNVRVMSFLFGSLHLGYSQISWDAAQQSFLQVRKHSCQLPGDAPVYAMVSALSGLFANKGHHSQHVLTLLKVLLEHSLDLIVQSKENDMSKPQHLYQNACAYIQDNYHTLLTRDRLAEHFEVSPNYLSRVFRQYGNIGISEYINNVRIEQAKFMLKRYEFQLHEISRRCGFHNVNYFCRSFKVRVGRTPTEFRLE